MNPLDLVLTQLHPIGPYKWCAFYETSDSTEDGLMGWGRTEQEAKEDLEDQIEEEREEQQREISNPEL